MEDVIIIYANSTNFFCLSKISKLGFILSILIGIMYFSAKAQLPSSDIPLDPLNGGLSIPSSALKSGDIIVSTTNQSISAIIRTLTKSEVSHAILYIGNGNVIEAVAEGVTVRPIEESLSDARLAVAFRYKDLDAAQSKLITDFAFSQLGKKFSIAGLVRHPTFGILAESCEIYAGVKRDACKLWEGVIKVSIELKVGSNIFAGKDEFFCSQLVAESFKKAQIDLFKTRSETTSPGNIPILERIGDLRYVGHLKTTN